MDLVARPVVWAQVVLCVAAAPVVAAVEQLDWAFQHRQLAH